MLVHYYSKLFLRLLWGISLFYGHEKIIICHFKKCLKYGVAVRTSDATGGCLQTHKQQLNGGMAARHTHHKHHTRGDSSCTHLSAWVARRDRRVYKMQESRLVGAWLCMCRVLQVRGEASSRATKKSSCIQRGMLYFLLLFISLRSLRSMLERHYFTCCSSVFRAWTT